MSRNQDKHLHIISFDIPYPADYGGVIDVYYKIKALFKEGIKVHLHCFEYGRKASEKLNEICYSVNYYPRKKGLSHLLASIPYIVSTRACKKLLNEIKKDNYPILYEGLHSTALLHFRNMSERINMVRMHNIEHDYYVQLSKASTNLIKKWYYKSESQKLKKYESVLKKADHIFSISISDQAYLSSKYSNVHYISAFHPNEEITSLTGKGSYILYHGNLSVEENEKAVVYLLENIFNKLNIPCVIAGKNPSKIIWRKAKKLKNVEIVENPDKHTMKELIQEAHINILPTFQATGIKLKLLESLALGRFCIVNTPMVENTGLEKLTIIHDQSDQLIREVNQLMTLDFSENTIAKRKKIWSQSFDNQLAIQKLSNYLN